MGQIKRLSANDVMRVTGVSGKQARKVTWHTAEFIMRPLLSIESYSSLVDRIINDCFDENGVFNLGVLDFSLRKNIVSAYAFVDLPTDVDDLYRVLYSSDLFDTVCRYANQAQLESILRVVTIYVGEVYGRN